jgi:hypothetical protein
MIHPKERHLRRSLVVWPLAIVCLLACAHSQPATVINPEGDEGEPAIALKHVVVIPFHNLSARYGPNVGLRGPLSNHVFETGITDPLADGIMTDVLIQALQENLPELQITKSDVKAFHLHRPPGSEPKDELIDAVRELGKRRTADGVLIGFLYDYHDREGGALGVSTPSRVTFEMSLIGVASGRAIWHKQFSEVQRPLSENLLLLPQFIQRRGQWITAREMAREAMDKVLKTIPKTD